MGRQFLNIRFEQCMCFVAISEAARGDWGRERTKVLFLPACEVSIKQPKRDFRKQTEKRNVELKRDV